MPALYLEDLETFIWLYCTKPLDHSRVSALWMHIFSKYFHNNEGFVIQPEYRFPDGTKADACVVYEPRGSNFKMPAVAVIESKPTDSKETWENAFKQAFDYAKSRKKAKKTLAIVAKGPQFLMFVVPGSQMADTIHWCGLGGNNDGSQHPNGTPYHVLENSDALQRVILELKPDILNGHFSE